jgi:tetratricopeptide (TPR) repeat protein
VWRSKEPLPNLRLASLTTDSIDALRSYLEGERYYRRTEWDSALSAYTRAVETDSTFALAHLRRAQAFGWIGGYGNKDAHEAVAAGVRFAKRLPPRDRRLMAAYQLFDRGKPASIDSLRAFLVDYPEDVEGWFLLGEAMFHTKSFRPSAPDSIVAVFDSVLRRDSTLFPALIHPMELGIMYRDSARFGRYFHGFERTAPANRVTAMRTTAHLLWGPPPTDKAIGTAWTEQGSWLIQAANSAFYWDEATSDSIASRYARVQQGGPQTPAFLAGALEARAQVFAGLGRWRDAKVLVDSLARLDLGDALGVQAWAMALGLAPGLSAGFMDSAVAALPAGPEVELAKAIANLLRGQVPEGRRRLARALADSARMSSYDRGMMVAADGWGALIQGDTVRGLPRLRSGLDQVAAPGVAAESAFLRLQLALALAGRKATREEGIMYFKYGFDNQPLYLPLLQLALGRTYEAAGQRDSAVAAYRRFLRFWDKADPGLQGRVKEAQAALQELTREQPGSQ